MNIDKCEEIHSFLLKRFNSKNHLKLDQKIRLHKKDAKFAIKHEKWFGAIKNGKFFFSLYIPQHTKVQTIEMRICVFNKTKQNEAKLSILSFTFIGHRRLEELLLNECCKNVDFLATHAAYR